MKELPDTIIPIPCSDKDGWTEEWYDKRNLLNIPHPFRCYLVGPPSSGKSTLIKNIILRTKPHFKEVLVYHFDPENSSEWDDIEAKIIDKLPDPKSLDRDKKRLLIIEDCNLKNSSVEDRATMNRLFGYTSSHVIYQFV